jgi:hypothetical protein
MLTALSLLLTLSSATSIFLTADRPAKHKSNAFTIWWLNVTGGETAQVWAGDTPLDTVITQPAGVTGVIGYQEGDHAEFLVGMTKKGEGSSTTVGLGTPVRVPVDAATDLLYPALLPPHDPTTIGGIRVRMLDDDFSVQTSLASLQFDGKRAEVKDLVNISGVTPLSASVWWTSLVAIGDEWITTVGDGNSTTASLFAFNPTTKATRWAPLTLDGNPVPFGVQFTAASPSGTLYGIARQGTRHAVVSIAPDTGALTSLSLLPANMLFVFSAAATDDTIVYLGSCGETAIPCAATVSIGGGRGGYVVAPLSITFPPSAHLTGSDVTSVIAW